MFITLNEWKDTRAVLLKITQTVRARTMKTPQTSIYRHLRSAIDSIYVVVCVYDDHSRPSIARANNNYHLRMSRVDKTIFKIVTNDRGALF